MPVVITPDTPLNHIMDLCDGIVISGGEDIPAEVYGGERLLTVPEPLERIMWERMLIDRCEEQSVPLLGVCYGMQLLALHYGGALYQDIETEVADGANHVKTAHLVKFTEDFLGFARDDQAEVASRHHQAVATLPDRFSLSAVSSDGVIEGMSSELMYGTQWHPESDTTGPTIYSSFVDLCAKRAGMVYKQG